MKQRGMGVQQYRGRLGRGQQRLSLGNAGGRIEAVKPLPLPMVSKARPRHRARRLQAWRQQL